MTRPVVVSTNSRREMVELMGPPGCVRGARCAVASGVNRAPRTAHACSGYLSDRQFSYPLPRGREDRVAYRGRDRPYARLADATLLLGARHHVHLHDGHLVDVHHRVVGEVALLHPAAVDGDLAVQRGGEAVHDAALDLRLDLAHVH